MSQVKNLQLCIYVALFEAMLYEKFAGQAIFKTECTKKIEDAYRPGKSLLVFRILSYNIALYGTILYGKIVLGQYRKHCVSFLLSLLASLDK